ncbi:nuclease [Granulicella sp. WH15]|uniref:S1/P1 nuclease n=1 Tax=Granulicella sp. WH15 TaxID=2602070 RepID=UPI001366A3B3|nr:S1/P1 nuclease [Granulicella sp. WH15]QHN05228.1 nuclease [Granulicella sp. WH15]
MIRLRLLRSCLLFVIPALLPPPSAFAWGVDGHRMINRLACSTLPTDVPAFLRSTQAMSAMSYYAPMPDHWRGVLEPELTAATAPEHYIQLETVDKVLTQLPRKRYDYVRALALSQASHPDMVITAEKVGMQPYQADEVWERLKVAMRDYRAMTSGKEDTRALEAEIVFLAGWLGHYVGDGSMPLHTSDKPNGWNGPNPNEYTTEHKIHGLFESEFVHNNIQEADVAPLVVKQPAAVGDVFNQYVDYLRHSHTLVEDTYRLEKAGAFNGEGTAEGKKFASQQLAAAATELRDLIYTAWLQSAEPVPPRVTERAAAR